MPKNTTRRDVIKGGMALAGTVGAASLMGVHPSIAQSKSRLVILASGDNQVYYEYINNQFKQDYPNIEIELQTVGYEQLYTKAASILATGSSDVDIVEMDIIWVADFAKNQWALPLNDYLTDTETSQFRPGLLDTVTSGGQVYGLPIGTQFKVLFYNRELLSKIGATAQPATYEELAEVGAAAQKAGLVKFIQGFGWNQSEYLICDWTSILHAFGGGWFRNGQWGFNDDAAVTALSFMVDNLKSGIFDPASVTFNDRMVMNPFFVSDYEAMTSWGLWGWNMSNNPSESKVVGKVDVGLQYGGRQSGVLSATCSGGGGLAVTKNSRNVDAAVEWLKRLSGINHPENQIFSLEKVGNMPGTTAVWENPEVIKKMPVLGQIKEQSNYIVSRPGANVTGYQNWSNMVQEQLSAALTGQKSPKAALDDAVSRSNSEFAPIGV